MKRLTLLTGVAAALAFGGTSAIAQMQQKGPEEKGGAQMQAPPSAQQQAPQPQTLERLVRWHQALGVLRGLSHL